MKKLLWFLLLLPFLQLHAWAQGCCSGGSASPMVGGVSMGVLQQGQFDISESYQLYYSNHFMAGNQDSTSATVQDLKSEYLYTRFGYGISSRLSLYGEVGYFLHKTETGFHPEQPDYIKESSGFADLILLPRYNVFEKSSAKYHSELTMGFGIKLPLGNYHDSTTVYVEPNTGKQINMVSPPTVQTTTGSNDFIFYGFYLHELKQAKLKLFSSATYILKGYNGMGEKFGDFFGLGFFASKNISKKWSLTGQLRYEQVGIMKLSPNVDFIAKGISVEPENTGSKKISIVPQVMWAKKSLTLYALYDLPLYQYMNGFQIANKHLFTIGFAYRFRPEKFIFKEVKESK